MKEYLISLAKFSEGDSSCLIAESCLGYLSQFTTPGSLNNENMNNFQLAGYAARYWVDHARDAEQSDKKSKVIEELTEELFNINGAIFVTWIQLWDPESWLQWTDFARRPTASPLYYASMRGLYYHVQRLIEKGQNVNAQGGKHGNALQAASLYGNQEIVKMLMDKGADVNAQGGGYSNALHAA